MSLVLSGDTGVQGNSGAFVAGTAVASTSGTSIDFTSIPSWVKRITVMLNGVSTNGTSNPQIQIGSGSVDTTGYNSFSSFQGTSVTISYSLTSGFSIGGQGAGNILYGSVVFTLIGSNTWIQSLSGGLNGSGTPYSLSGGGSKALGGTLDRVRITTVNGTDTFDAGSINILYE